MPDPVNHPARLLVALQDLEPMIKEAEDPRFIAHLESVGLPVTGLDNLRDAHEKLEDDIPPALLARYRRLVDRTGRAVVPVVAQSCTGCFAQVPSSFTSSVNDGRIMACETCGRILFWP